MVLMLNQRVVIAMVEDAYQFAIILLLQILVSTRNTKFCSDDRVVRAITLKLVFTATMFDAQHCAVGKGT